MKTYADFGIELPSGASGVNVRAKCPKCSHTHSPAKRNQKDLSVNVSEGVWNCHRPECGWTGSLGAKASWIPPTKSYVAPDVIPTPAKSDYEQVVEWFKNERGISRATLELNKITAKRGSRSLAVAFPYFRDGEHINTTFRTIDSKSFFQSTGAERIYYGLDNITPETNELIIVEGQCDALAFNEAGHMNVLSVPNGAGVSKTGNQFDYHDSAVPLFERMDKVYIATDNDEPGRALAKELVRRIGVEKCHTIHWPDGIKDANDALLEFGPEGLSAALRDARPWPVKAIKFGYDRLDDVLDFYRVGANPGVRLGWSQMDNMVRFRLGSLAIVTGHPSHGKSTWLDHLAHRFAIAHDWKTAYFTPENYPTEEHIAHLIEIHTRKPFAQHIGGHMSEADIISAYDFIDEHFMHIEPETTTIDAILDNARILVKQRGINVLIIDPWTHIDKENYGGKTETQFTEYVLPKIVDFNHKNNVLTIVSAHPHNMEESHDNQEKVPRLQNVSGSGAFRKMADYGFSIWRDVRHDKQTEDSQCHVLKVRKRATGTTGMIPFGINWATRTLEER